MNDTEQLDLFYILEQDLKIPEVINKVNEYNQNSAVAAVYIPPSELIFAEPSFAVKQD